MHLLDELARTHADPTVIEQSAAKHNGRIARILM
jgi:hypothetical protein